MAPDNIASDEFGGEFVFRQPRDEAGLLAVVDAARIECFDRYRFDGLSRWSTSSVEAWIETEHALGRS